jgi:hypothetical protein
MDADERQLFRVILAAAQLAGHCAFGSEMVSLPGLVDNADTIIREIEKRQKAEDDGEFGEGFKDTGLN